jgi:hypothetical protein
MNVAACVRSSQDGEAFGEGPQARVGLDVDVRAHLGRDAEEVASGNVRQDRVRHRRVAAEASRAHGAGATRTRMFGKMMGNEGQ